MSFLMYSAKEFGVDRKALSNDAPERLLCQMFAWKLGRNSVNKSPSEPHHFPKSLKATAHLVCKCCIGPLVTSAILLALDAPLRDILCLVFGGVMSHPPVVCNRH